MRHLDCAERLVILLGLTAKTGRHFREFVAFHATFTPKIAFFFLVSKEDLLVTKVDSVLLEVIPNVVLVRQLASMDSGVGSHLQQFPVEKKGLWQSFRGCGREKC